MPTDNELLRDYARDRSESAFTELVRRHVDMVYSAALRETHGDAPLAEDITQAVFSEVARKAFQLCSHPALAGWLYTCVRQMTANARRAEDRRLRRELEAHTMNEVFSHDSLESDWRQIQPMLDDAMHELDEADRAAVVLRFFEDRSHKEVGLALGFSESAARKRVDRALERLRTALAKRGVTTAASGIAVVISANAVQAAPVGLAVTISTAALAGATLVTTATIAATKAIAMTTLQKILVAAIIVGSLATPLFLQHRAQVRLREQAKTLSERAVRLAKLRTENEGFSNLLAQAQAAQPALNEQFNEVLRLRGEVGRLQATVRELTGLKANEPLSREEVLNSMRQLYCDRVNRLKQSFAANPAAAVPELQYLTDKDWLEMVTYDHHRFDPDGSRALSSARGTAQIRFSMGALSNALREYGKSNQGQFPTDLSQLTPYFQSPVDDSVLQGWAILPTRSLPAGLRVDEDWVITQKAPMDAERDQRIVVGLKVTRLGSGGSNDWVRVP